MADERITVVATATDHQVVLWEVDPNHPNGEIFIAADGREHEVARTSQVNERLRDGRLTLVEKKPSKGEKKEPPKPPTAPTAPTPDPAAPPAGTTGGTQS